MTNPMLAELDEVVRLIAKEDADERLSILRDNEELNNACYWFAKNHHATLADMAKRLEAAERDASPVSALEALLPGTYYMDPPDGGDVSVYEQLRRMAKDAARYRWLRDNGEQMIGRDRGNGPEWTYGDDLDAAIDATQEGEG